MPDCTRATPDALTAAERHARLASPTRLAALRATGLLDGVADPVLDRLTRLVTRLLGVPVAVVSLVDAGAQHFPGMTGLAGWAADGRGTPLSHSFCQHVVATDGMLIVEDAGVHPVLRESPGHTELGVVAYAGVPLRTAEGETLGTLCAIDVAPVQWTDAQIATLEDLASAAMAEVELRATVHALVATQEQLLRVQERLQMQAVHDDLTGLFNRRGFGEQARQYVARAQRTKTPFLVVAMDLDGFKQINDVFGHDAGDEALMAMAAVLTQRSRASDVVARLGGDEFVLLLEDTDLTQAEMVRGKLLAAVADQNASGGQEYQLAVSLGFAEWSPASPMPLAALLRAADGSMYEEKRRRQAARAGDPRAVAA